jgi:Zn-dependent M28 family amino/carboxypeptidase
MDHLGLRGGLLHPGADDNASGVAALLEIARAFAKTTARPRRSVIFAFWTAEEAGQLGSQYYVRQPAWSLAHTAAYLNLDMIAHPWTAEEIRALVTAAAGERQEALLAQATPANFAEPGLAKWAPELGAALASAARGMGLVLHLDRGEGVEGGSDYRAFARRGVPWVRFFGNYFPGYHQPEDTVDRVDPRQVQRIARLAFATAWLLAQ